MIVLCFIKDECLMDINLYLCYVVCIDKEVTIGAV